MGCPVCPLGLRSFVPVWLATAQSQYSPDETSPEKSCFSTLLPQLSQQKHKHTITHTNTHTHTSHQHRHPLPKKLTERRKESRNPLRIITPSPSFLFSFSLSFSLFHTYTHTSLIQLSLWSFGDCASGLCSPMMNDLPKNTVCTRASAASRWKNLPPK